MPSSSKIRTVALLLGALTLAGCNMHTQNQTAGTIIGAGLGAFLGHAIGGDGGGRAAGAAFGALLGGAVGSEVGRKLDERDRLLHERARYFALEHAQTGQPSRWENPENGHRGWITPGEASRRSGQYCREYTQSIMVAGELQEGYGTACRQADGSWRIVG